MTLYTIFVKYKNHPIPFPNNPQLGDQAEVYFPPSKGTRLIHYYIYTLKGWQYTDYKVINA